MKVYIAGKITGDENYKAKFKATADKLAKCGHIVLNPAVLPAGMEQADYMRICMAMLDSADYAVFLPDYQQSEGAMIEWNYCQRVGKIALCIANLKRL